MYRNNDRNNYYLLGIKIKGEEMISEQQLKGLRIGWKNKNNDNNPMWKGDDVKYGALHGWIRRRKYKPKFCESCKKNKPYDLANISGKYNRDINDFKWLCRSCHMKEDGRIEKLRLSYKPRIKNLIKVICLNCNKEYYVCHALLNSTKFCCRECHNQYRSKNKLFYGNQYIKCRL